MVYDIILTALSLSLSTVDLYWRSSVLSRSPSVSRSISPMGLSQQRTPREMREQAQRGSAVLMSV